MNMQFLKKYWRKLLLVMVAVFGAIIVTFLISVLLRDPTDLNLLFSNGQCQDKSPVKLGAAPMRPEDIGLIIPLGLMSSGHVTPADHIYFYPKDRQSAPFQYNVYAPDDGFIVQVGYESGKHALELVADLGIESYTVVIEHSCNVYTVSGIINTLTPEILSAVGKLTENRSKQVRIPVKAGQVIGKIGGPHSLDFWLYDNEKISKGFVVPKHYLFEAPKIHTADPFEYFTEPVKSQLLALNLRRAEPRGGKIDYDIDGRLVGTWFKENTNGYGGAETEGPTIGLLI